MCFCVRVIPGDRVTPPTLTPPPLDAVTVGVDWAGLEAVACVRTGALAWMDERVSDFDLRRRREGVSHSNSRQMHSNRKKLKGVTTNRYNCIHSYA